MSADDDGVLRDSGPVKEFVRRAAFDQDELVGARWWNESFTAFASRPLFGRRQVISKGLGHLVAFGSVAAIFGGVTLCERLSEDGDGGTGSIDYDALDLQRRDGWNVGHVGQSLRFSGATNTDVENGDAWKGRLSDLLMALSPRDGRLLPHATTTLFQAIASPANASLRAVMQPVFTPAMEEAFLRGKAMRELLTKEAPADVALILDLPGPESVAAAAGLAPVLAPLFQFDNWPHPLGVVPSHLTLGACLYYLPLFDSAANARPSGARPVFVLDANRLAPYRDNANQFDNRYMAPLPSEASLQALGIKRLLYVRPSGANLTELDDLNTDFVAFERAGIDVRAVGFDDFQRANLLTSSGDPVFHYGGAPYHHIHFWNGYGWARPGSMRSVRNPPPIPARVLRTTQYRPVPRPTLFSTRSLGGLSGIGKQKPSGFGKVSVRSGGYAGGSSRRRSGSFGRSRSSYSG
ncbi:MAG TPA: hypothetical protein VGF45_14310 [Polyangia bacterium]